jgi:hypothetical protein
MTISTTAVPSRHAEKTVVLAVGIVLALIVAAMVIMHHRAAPIRAAAALSLAAELAAESKAFCEKHGMQANTQAHTACVSDLQAVRDRQTERLHHDNQIAIF